MEASPTDEAAVLLLLRVWPDADVQLLPSLLLVQQQQQQLSGSLAADGQLITSITGTEPSAGQWFVQWESTSVSKSGFQESKSLLGGR